MAEGIDGVGAESGARRAARQRHAGPVLIVSLRRFVDHFSHPYHPERYYMRGPGPACQAKQAQPGAASASGPETFTTEQTTA